MDEILEGFERRDQTALARAISLVENQRDGFERVLAHAYAKLRKDGARRIGITGPPGAGKSTLTERLIQQFRGGGVRVGVIAVDPTSPFTGGALLGDRIRMESTGPDPDVFIRSMATRGSHGGLATTTEEVADLLEAFGFERILIETVGVGQAELDIAASADTTVLVLVPESGDAIQTLKAGVMEAADLYVINKSDRPGADKLRQEVAVMLGMRHRSPDSWEPAVLETVATTGEGIGELGAALERHYAYLQGSGRLAAGRRNRLQRRLRAVVERAVRQWVWDATRAEELVAERLDDVAAGRESPYDVAAEILQQLKSGAPG